MMLGRMSRKASPVVREKIGGCSTLENVLPRLQGFAVVACEDGDEGFNLIIRDNFRVPDQAALEVVLPQGKGDLGALGDPAATGVPKQPVQKMGDKRFRKPKKTHEPVVVPPLVPEVIGGSAAAGGSIVGVKPVDDKKRNGDAPVAGGQKGPKLRRPRTAAIPQPKPAVTTETGEEPVYLFATPPSSPKAADVEVQKEGRRSPSIEMVTPPSVQVEDTARKTAGETIADTLDSSNNLIDPHDAEGQGGKKPKSPVVEKLKSPVVEKAYSLTAAGTGVEDQPSIQPDETELEFHYHSYAVDRGLDYHRPPWSVMQGDDVSNDPLACRDILRGLGTPFEVLRAVVYLVKTG
ncbi:hypothetical protein Hdeb2414_s0121g00803251 [Helianthus debilis subsp. tardiflorus]